jgi:hypothetical protein
VDESAHVETESVPPDGYLRPRKVRLVLRCLRCGNVYRTKPALVVPRIDPPCPRMQCRVDREVERRLADEERIDRMLDEQRPPAQVGRNPATKAPDFVAEQVMRDYKLTNLNDNMREGDIAAPKLPAQQQRAADSFFTGQEVARRAGGRRMQARVAQMGAQILGARAPMPAANIRAIQSAVAQPGESSLVAQPTNDPFMVRMVPRR